ncbi:MAG: glycosyltransferase family 2 protein [Ruminococcus sp.]|jgi:glycosyltransferase involved in cell wall biosynthesis|nr:glycosyltransferase family 2 protein [Ruminococcus sp.]
MRVIEFMETLDKNILGEFVFDKETAENILEKLKSAESYHDEVLHSSDSAVCFSLCDEITGNFAEILQLKQETKLPENRIFKQAECVIYSLQNVAEDFSKYSSLEKALYRLEFETFPIIEETTATFYYFNFAALDKGSEEEFWNPETGKAKDLYFNRYIADSIKTGEYKYELSVLIIAYNKCDMTKGCVESLLKWMPEDLNYELILCNHGSTDGVKSYFESVRPTKQLDIKINSCSLLQCYLRLVEGKYYLQVSNDVVFTPNAVENMLRACKDDPKIGYLVPSTPNVSGYQETNIGEYTTIEELNVLAEKNNVYDPRRHEERVSLCNPLALYPTNIYFAPDLLIGGRYYRLDEHKYAFPDDLTSTLIRRKGYKAVLQKDAYCHHFGSVTLGDEVTDADKDKSFQKYTLCSKKFKEYYGINPWSIGKAAAPPFFEAMEHVIKLAGIDGHIEILGINCGLGSDPLKIKTLYKEIKGNTDVHITNYTQFPWLLTDLETVSDKAVYAEDLMTLLKAEKPESYNYVVLEIPANLEYHTKEFIDRCTELVVYGGVFSIWCIEDYDINAENVMNYIEYPFHSMVKK